MLLEDIGIWKQALADALQHGVIRWLSHIFRIKLNMGYAGLSFLGYWLKTRRFPPIFSFKFWCFIISSFFKGVVCQIDNQYEDYEQDKGDPKKWGQPPRWVYKWTIDISIVAAMITASFVNPAFFILSGLEIIGVLSYTTSPIDLKHRPNLIMPSYMFGCGCLVPLIGYVGACHHITGLMSLVRPNTILNFITLALANSIIMVGPIWDFNTDGKHQQLISNVPSVVKKIRICLFGAFSLWYVIFKNKMSRLMSILGVFISDNLCNELLMFPAHGNVHKTETLCLKLVGCYACIYVGQIIHDSIQSVL